MQQRHGKLRGTRWQHNVLAIAVASCFAGNVALANPTGPAVAQGQASIATQGNTLTVTNSPGAVINWQGFSIAGNEITRFIQQSQSSSVLNRVVGVNPSTILGTLQSNGRVFLINPNGITVGPGANIDVAGFLASTLNLSDSDFIAGRMRFTETPGAGKVVNEGTITTATGGMVYLVGQDVKNSGIIRSPQGEIMLAAGKSVELVDAQTPEVRVQITAPENQALNVGQLIADGGRIGMYGTLVQNSGVVNANTAVMGENGKIIFKAVKDVTLDAGSVTTANGTDGGSVTAQAETGTLLASGTIEAKGESGKGGTVHLLGNQVGVIGNASVDVSGGSGGGTVLVGGDFQGSNPEVQNAARTFVGQDARIVADATEAGDGGKVIVWADNDTRYHGQISARGGLQSGDGGFVEVSGKEILNFDGGVNVGAVNGKSGTILLDPRDIIIQDANPSPSDGQVSDSRILFADTPVNSDYTISDESLEALTGSIVLQAQRDIKVNLVGVGSELVLANQKGSESERVAFQAGRHIIIDSAVKTDGAAIWLEADSPHVNGYDGITGASGADGKGAVRINAAVQSFLTDSATGGKITMLGGTNTQGGTNGGGFDLNADVNAGAGGIDVSLSMPSSGTLSFNIGSVGQAQFTTTDTGQLKSTGPLKIGQATTAGTNGLGTNALTIKVDQLAIGSTAGGPVSLAAAAGTSVEFTAGDGGILVDRPLTTSQSTTISTAGALTINQTLNTTNNNLIINAESISGVGLINTGLGSFSCTGEGCNTSSIITWLGSSNLDWFTAANWSGNVVPTINDEVRIPSSFSGAGPIAIAGAASAKNLIADYSVSLSGTLNLAQASQFTRGFTLTTGGSLTGAGHVVVNGNSGLLNWTGGTMASGGDFALGVGSSGALSGTLVLNRLFDNSGLLTLSGVSMSGTGTLANSATLTAASSTVNTLGVTLTNTALIQAPGSLTASAFPTNNGSITVGSGGAFSTGGAVLTNVASSSLIVDSGNYSTFSGSVSTTGGNLSVSGALNAGSVTLTAGGSVTLNAGSSITATGSASDSIVLSGASLVNDAGSTVLSPGAGRWLVYSAGPAGNTFGGLISGNKAIWGVGYPTAVAETGNRYVFSNAGAVTVTTTNATKTYGDAPINLSTNFTLTGKPVDAAAYGNVYLNSMAGDIFSVGPTIVSTGNTAIANAGGGGGFGGAYSITSTGTANAGYSLTSTDSGLLTVGTRAVTVTGDNQSRVYGDANPTLTYTVAADGVGTSRGLANSDSLSGVLATTAVVTSNVGNYATTQGTLTDGNNSNYAITYNDGNLAVGTRAVTVTGDNQSRVYGDANPTLTYTVAADGVGTSRGLANSDSLSGVLATTAVVTSNVGNYATTQGTLTDGNNSNYAITYNDGNLAVGTRAVTVTGEAIR